MKKETSPYFNPMIQHISWTWKKRKGYGYPFRGRDFKELKTATSNFPEWYLMALWDVFINSENDWVIDSGHSISSFLSCLPWLVDDPTWKEKAKIYQEKMAPIPKEISEVLKSNES